MPQLSDRDAALLLLAGGGEPEKKPNKMLEAAGRGARAAGEFAGGALEAFPGAAYEALKGVAGMLAPPTPESMARRAAETATSVGLATGPQPVSGPRILGPGQAPPATVGEAQRGSPLGYELGNQALMGIPGIVERGAHGVFGQKVMLGAPAGAGPNAPVSSTPMPMGARERGAALGTAAGESLPFWAAPAGEGLGRRFRPRPEPALAPQPPAPEAPGEANAAYDVVFTPDGPVYVPRKPGAAPASPFPEKPLALPQGELGTRPSTVQKGFTPVRAKYQVWIATRPTATEPGGKTPKPEFGQFKEVDALSQVDAIEQVKAEMDAQTPNQSGAFEFKANAVKGTARAVPEAAAKRMAEGKEPGLDRGRQGEGIVKQAQAAEAPTKPVVQPKKERVTELGPVVEAPKEEGSGPVPAKSTPKRPTTPLRTPEAEGKAAPAELPFEAVSKVESEKPIGGKSKVIREPTPEEAKTLAPGEQRQVGEFEKIVRPSAETEAKLKTRTGTGGGATSFGEERGSERRVEQAPVETERRRTFRRPEDRAKFAAEVGEAEKELKTVKTWGMAQLETWWSQHRKAPLPSQSVTEMRDYVRRELQSVVKGGRPLLKESAPVPKAEAAAKAAPESISRGRESTVKTPGRELPVRYEEIPISELKPSHNPSTFEPNPDYPFEQQRDYRTNKIEQLKVREMARSFNPDYILADTPSATDGPPIISREGYVLGGNARTMALLRGLQEGTIDPAEYQATLMRAGMEGRFGHQGWGSKRNTVIVRRMTEPMSIEEQAKVTKALNEDFKMAVDPVSDAVARARNLSAETVEWVANVLNDVGPEATVRSAIFDDPARLTDLMRHLAEDQVVVSSELPRLLDAGTSRLTPEGQRLIEAAVIGRVIKSPKMIREMSPSLKNVVLGGLSELTRGETFPIEWRVNNDVVNGLWLHHMADKASKTIDMMLEPQLYPEPFLDAVRDNRVAIALAKWFEANKSKSTALRGALQKYNRQAADAVSGQEVLSFALEGRVPHEAFNEAFGTKLSASDFGSGDGLVYLHAGLPVEALAPLWGKVSAKARQLRDWVLIPKDVREPMKPGESFQEWWQRGMYPRTGDSFRRWMAETWQSFAKMAILNHETRRFPYFHEQLDQFKVSAMATLETATNRMAEVVHPIVYRSDPVTGALKRRPAAEMQAAIQQFQLLVGVSDLWARAKAGLLTPASGFPAFSEFKPADVAAALEVEMRTIMHSASPAVKEAHANWIKWMTDLRGELVKRGKLGKEDRLGWAYAPNVINDLTWQQMWSVATGPIRVKEAVRPYVKEAVGHLRKHDPNMVRAGLQHATNVLLDNLLDDFAHSVGQAWDHYKPLWAEIEARAKKAGRTVEEEAKLTGIPREYGVYRVGGSKHLWNPATITEYVVDKVLQQDADLGLKFDNVWQVREYAGTPEGKARPAYIVPTPIVEALNQFREARGPLDRLAAQFHRGVSVWKAATLTSIIVPYSLRNVWGDFSNAVRRLPGSGPLPGLPAIGKLPRAITDIIRASGPSGKMSPELALADAVGVRQNTRAIAEMGDLRSHKDLRPFFRPRRSTVLRPIQRVFEAANDALAGMMIVDSVREGTMRYAAWLYLMENKFPAKRAERLVSETIGDYRSTDRFTGLARKSGIAPFAVWIRQMIPGWYRWFTGAKLGKYAEMPEIAERTPAVMAHASKIAKEKGIEIEQALREMAQDAAIPPPNVPRPGSEAPKGSDPSVWKAAHSGAYTKSTLLSMALGIGVPMTLLWYWNNVLHAEQNKRFDENFRNQNSYLILPWWKTPDGRSPAFAVPTPVDAVISFFGLGNPAERIRKFHDAAEKGPKEFAKQAWGQMGDTVAGIHSGLSDITGPPIDVLSALKDLGPELYKEAQKPEGKRDTWKVLRKKYERLYGKLVPGASGVRASQRTDLEGLPDYLVKTLPQYPWGSLIHVPLSDEEIKRRKNRNRPARKGLYPGIGTMSGGLKPISVGGQ